MDASQSHSNNPNLNPIPNPLASSVPVWPTIDGSLGLSEEESVKYARRFYKFGFALLPLLWAVNCFYFWPVIRHSRSFPRIRPCMYIPFPLFLFSYFFRNFLFFLKISKLLVFLVMCLVRMSRNIVIKFGELRIWILLTEFRLKSENLELIFNSDGLLYM